jgi:hypothetical protein
MAVPQTDAAPVVAFGRRFVPGFGAKHSDFLPREIAAPTRRCSTAMIVDIAPPVTELRCSHRGVVDNESRTAHAARRWWIS